VEGQRKAYRLDISDNRESLWNFTFVCYVLPKLLGAWGWTYGVQAQIARVLHCSEATISRDVAKLMPLMEECPTCHQLRPREWWRED
jgi:hypothetical protein